MTWKGVVSVFCAVLFLSVLLEAAPAAAQDKNFYLDRLYMAGAPDDTIAMWRPEMADKTRIYGQFGLGYSLNPFRTENHINDATAAGLFDATDRGGNPVGDQVIGYFTAGTEVLDRFGFQVSFPVIFGQSSNSTSFPEGGANDATDTEPVATMDMRLDLRAIAFRTTERDFKLGVNAAVWIPTGNEFSFGGDTSTSGGFFVSAEYDFRKFFLVANTGVQFRPSADLNDFKLQNEWRWAVGGFVPLRGGALRLGGQIFGSTGIGRDTTFTGDNTPVEWMVEGRYTWGRLNQFYAGAGGGTRLSAGYAPDFRVVGVVGTWFNIFDTAPPAPGRRYKADRFQDRGADTDKDGLPDDVDLCPTDPEDGKPPNTSDGCPALPDRDGDGIPDISDKCPDNPEDFDKIDDLDGCPEDDADKDGIADAKDACPKEPGEPSPEPAKNGCPQFIRRISGSSEIQVLKQIEFETNSAKIRPNSFKIVDEVVRLLQVNPEIKQMAIEGHTDNKGPDELNERLSNDRANSVRQYIVDKGIDAGRLTAQGFGPKRPIADNNTADGRQKNRRVEFHIRGQGGAPSKAETPPP
jgi:outer membrane protein OmpA-like peptidoglycan-associated protein